MQVQLESPNQSEVISPIAQLDAYQDTLYPAEVRYSLNLSGLAQNSVLFVVTRGTDGAAIGCGAVVLRGKAGELKRMFVHPQSRGQGTASKILAKLEHEAAKCGCLLLHLETGPYQIEALTFYKKHFFKCAVRSEAILSIRLAFLWRKISGAVSLQPNPRFERTRSIWLRRAFISFWARRSQMERAAQPKR